MAEKRSIAWRIDLLFFSVFMILYTALGAYISLARHYLPYDALSRLVSAWLVWGGTQTKLATIGFVWPPIPTMSLLPLAWIPSLVQNWIALVIVSAFFMAISVVLVYRILQLCGVGAFWRWVLAILFGLNPLNIVFGINGMSEAIMVAGCLAAFYMLLLFWESNRNMHLILAAFFFSLLPLIRYEFALLSAAAGALIIFHSWGQRANLSANAFRDFLEGRLLAFSSMAIYPIFLWSLASWMIMGSPLYFLVNDRSATSLAGLELTGFGINAGFSEAFSIIFNAWFASFPAGLVALLILLFLSWQKQSLKYLGFALISLLLPTLQLVMLLNRTTIPLLRYFMTTVLFGFVLLAIALSALRKEYRLTGMRMHLVSGAAVVIVLLSNLATANTLNTYPYQNMEQQTWRALLTQDVVEDVDFTDAYKIGQLLPTIVKPGSRVLIDTYQFGFGIMLGSNNPKMFMDFTDPNYDQAVLDPTKFVDYVIVPKTDGRGALYTVNREFPKLHDQGAIWATQVEGLPETNGAWRLYKVTR